MKVVFFGCWKQTGHFLYDPSGATLQSFGPFLPESLDGRFQHRSNIPGWIELIPFKDHTVIAFKDNTVDRRPGSNAAFIVEGYALTRQQCWTEARKLYPQIVERLKNHVRMDDL